MLATMAGLFALLIGLGAAMVADAPDELPPYELNNTSGWFLTGEVTTAESGSR